MRRGLLKPAAAPRLVLIADCSAKQRSSILHSPETQRGTDPPATIVSPIVTTTAQHAGEEGGGEQQRAAPEQLDPQELLRRAEEEANIDEVRRAGGRCGGGAGQGAGALSFSVLHPLGEKLPLTACCANTRAHPAATHQTRSAP